MIFDPKNSILFNGYFRIPKQVRATAHPCLDRDVIRDFWHGFTFRTTTLTVTATDTTFFRIGSTEPLPLDGYAYSIHVDESGVCVSAENERDLRLGMMTLLDRIKMIEEGDDSVCVIDCCQIKDSPAIQTRMVHFCVFPETKLFELQRFIRFCAALRYSHIILEFWGMLQYDCLKELAWPFAFSKDEVRPILSEARDLGLEIIPMFNHWGHASASRVMHGKHVVLDQSPQLHYLFSDNGWCWDIHSPKVQDLLRSIRKELIELCGKGDYFHIGCDEAYGFDMTNPDERNTLCDYINGFSAELEAIGRRAIAWGDMFLYRHPHYNPNNYYHANAPTPEVELAMLERLDRRILIADWQYDATEAPVETALVFQKAGFDTLLCPWDRSVDKLNSCLSTVKDAKLYGLLHTTWHTLSKGMPYVMLAALGGFESTEGLRTSRIASRAASLLRKVYFVDGDYKKAGWSRKEIDDIT